MAPSTKQMPPPAKLVTIEPLPCYNVAEPGDDRRVQILSKLLNSAHRSVAPLRDPDLVLHSHMPHVRPIQSTGRKSANYLKILGSAFYLGVSAQQIQVSHDTVIKTLKDIDSQQFIRSEDAITRDTFRDCMLKKEYVLRFENWCQAVRELG